MTVYPDDRLRTADAHSPTPAPPLHMRVTYPDPATARLEAAGTLDEVTTHAVQELLMTRLNGTIETVVLDLSRLEFLGLSAVHILVQASQRAEMRGIDVRLLPGPSCVERALRAAGLSDRFDRTEPAPHAERPLTLA